MARGAENRYMAVWFDFREGYRVDGKIRIGNLDATGIPASTWQRQFACRLQGLLNEPIRHPVDFPSFLLLNLLRADITVFEKFVSRDQELLPVTTHTPVVTGYLEKRLDGFELTQSMIRKAEGIHRLVTHMSSSRALDLIPNEFRSSYEQTLYHLEIGSSLLILELRRQDELADKRLEVHNRFAQLRQTSSLSALTYCAAFFLPFSLAGTFLSMQSRSKDLHLIVYDFCGITSVFCTLAALIYFLSWAWSRWKTGRLNRRLENGEVQLYLVGKSRSTKIFFGVAWILMVGSFLVGMLYNLRLGLIMLAAPTTLIVLLALCALAIYFTMDFLVMVQLALSMGVSKAELQVEGCNAGEANMA
jgi:hypothetical protein